MTEPVSAASSEAAGDPVGEPVGVSDGKPVGEPVAASVSGAAPTTASPPANQNGTWFGGPGTGFMILLGLALATIALGGLTSIGSLVGPIFLALTLAITARPAIGWLRAHKVPSALSTLLVLLAMYAVAAAMVFAVTVAVSSLVNVLPTYQHEFNDLYAGVLSWLQGRGVSADQIATAAKKIDITSLIGIVPGILGGVSAASTQLLTLLLALAFLILDTADVSQRAVALRRLRPQLAAALEDFTWRVRRYWIVSTVFGLMSASLDFIALLILGVPMPFTWALLAFVANYIPNIGFVIALAPVALLGLLAGGVSTAIWVIVAYCLINVLVQTVIQPRFIGNAVGLGTTLTFISLIFWAGIIGPLGAVLAVPLTLFFKAVIIGSSPGLQWLEVFFQSGDDPPKARA